MILSSDHVIEMYVKRAIVPIEVDDGQHVQDILFKVW